MKILFDTNIILDVLLNRSPYATAAIKLLAAVENKELDGVLCATTITTIDYLVTKATDKDTSRKGISCLLDMFTISSVQQSTLKKALESEFSDFEDAVLFYSGVECGINALVTRNGVDFKAATVPVYTPIELLTSIACNM